MKLKFPKWMIEATGHIYLHKYPMFLLYKPNIHKVRGEDVRKILDIVEPADILLRRFDGYLNTIFTEIIGKSFWGHAGTYIGNNQMVHSVSVGCITEDILNFCRADAVCILEPIYPEVNKQEIVTKAKLMAQMGMPYDYEFSSTNDAFYCTETVDMINNRAFDKDYIMKAGNKVLTPDGIYDSMAVKLKLQINYGGNKK